MTTLSQLAQLQLELINRARMDPAAEAARHGLTSVNQFIQASSSGFPITTDPKQVLAGNNQLTAAAVGHSNEAAVDGFISHTGNGDGTPGSRIINAGYTGNNVTRDENISSQSANASNSNPAALPTRDQYAKQFSEQSHFGLFFDDPTKMDGEDGGHRLAMLDPSYKEVGIGVNFQYTNTGNSVSGKYFQTQNFGNQGTQSFLTGAVYNDTNKDNFYGLGEAVSGVTVTVRNAANAIIGSDTTGEGGGWSVGEPGGTYKVTFSAAGKANVAATIEAGSLNAKMDLVNGNEIYANANTTLNEGALGLRLIGIQNINGTGNADANVITGNAGGNVLTGMGGNDTIDGLGGTDTVVFLGRQSDYKITVNGGTATLQDLRSGSADGTDTITNVELVKFADATVAYSALRTTTVPVAGSVVIGDASITEGNAGTKVMTFTLTRSGGTAAFDVNFATGNGTATAGEDYAAASGIVRFAAGETQKTVSVTINGDTKFEGAETFNINLSNATNGATIADATAVGTIQNDDAQPVAGSVVIGDTSVAEGNAGTKVMTFTLTRSGGTAAFDVNFATANGTATLADGDYLASSGIVRFAAGETKKTVSVTINGDTRFEANETFKVNLSGATNGATIADATGIGTITNDDKNRAPTIAASNVTLAGGDSVAVSSIFAGQDLDGNSTITKYAFWDSGNGGGYFTVNGVAQASGQWIQVDAVNLGTVRYVGGVNGGLETLWATAFDGNAWSVNKSASVTTFKNAPTDFNNDGNSDILFHNDSGSVAMWQMDGMKLIANATVGTQASSWHAADAFDFNGDGKADILWHNDSGQAQLWQMDGTKVTQKLDLGSMGAGWHVGGVDDFNGDGKAEVLWFGDNKQVQLWTMNGAAHTTQKVGTIGSGWSIKDTTDFNGDGKADILLQSGSKVAMWQMDGATIAKQANFTMGDAFHFAGTGDFNADGRSDILWHNDTSGQLVLWEMNGTSILSNTGAGFTAKGWDIADIGDYNHDGHADLMLRNATTGAMAEWQMDGNQILAQQGLGSVSTDWHLI